MKKVAAIDVDGVLLDCDGAFAEVASNLLNRPLPKLNTSYNLSKRYDITESEVYETFDYMKTHPRGWASMQDIKGAIKSVKALQDNGWDVQLVTAIPKDLEQMRLTCLATYGFIPDGIHCVGHHLAGKSDVIKEIGASLMVDDRLKHLYEAPFVNTRVWVDHGDEQDGLKFDGSVIKVKSISDFADEFLNKSKSKSTLISKSRPFS